jgi:hypothetical protein
MGVTEELWFSEWEFRAPGDKRQGQPWRYFDRPAASGPFRKWSPMLSIRNAKTLTLSDCPGAWDYRLDVSEGSRLSALQRLNVPSRMLYFRMRHWVLKPQNSRRWYDEVWASVRPVDALEHLLEYIAVMVFARAKKKRAAGEAALFEYAVGALARKMRSVRD